MGRSMGWKLYCDRLRAAVAELSEPLANALGPEIVGVLDVPPLTEAATQCLGSPALVDRSHQSFVGLGVAKVDLDGRLADVIESGVLPGTVVMPRFV